MEFLTLAQKIYFGFMVGFIGLAIGSFLNVVALRLLAEENFVKGRSKCPKCENMIAWYDNIPVLSYILLLGKCRKCGERISLQYPIVELFTGAIFIATVSMFGFTLKTLFLLVLICNLIVITITDLKEKYIFDMNSIPLIPIGLVYNFFDIGNTSVGTVKVFGISFNDVFISALIGAVIGVAFFEIFSRIGLLLAGEYAFGAGDSILAAALGAWFGWKLMLIILVLSFLSQLVVGIPVVVYNMYRSKDYPSLWAMGALLVSVLMTFIGRYYTYAGETFIALGIILLSFVIVGISIFVILKRTRERQSYTFLPFGPALVIAGFLVIFFSQQLLSYFPY
jgi:leader peptidase (prepilin peptidase)/N-methyltransferase